jgi:hypothetical protein
MVSYKGLEMRINSVSLTNESPSWENESKKVPVVKLSITVKNTTDSIFDVGAYQSGLVTSAGEHISSSLRVSDQIDYIDPGEIKNGDIVFFLEKTKDVKDIRWIEWYFITRHLTLNGKQIEPKQEYIVKLDLK